MDRRWTLDTLLLDRHENACPKSWLETYTKALTRADLSLTQNVRNVLSVAFRAGKRFREAYMKAPIDEHLSFTRNVRRV